MRMGIGQLDNEEIIRQLQKHRAELSDLEVERIGLSESYAKDTQGSGSDIDFLVEFNEVSFDSYMELKFFLEDLFERNVDLVVEEDLKPSLQYVKKDAEYVITA